MRSSFYQFIRAYPDATIGGRLSHAKLDALATEAPGFQYWNVADSRITLAELIGFMRSDEDVVPMRTGHIGNWSDIYHARAGLLDYNATLCRDLSAARAVIYCLNRVEDKAKENGDWIYLPGSLVEKGIREPLKLYNDSDRGFVPNLGEATLTPLTFIEREGEFVSLVDFHRRNLDLSPGLPWILEPELVASAERVLKPILTELVGRHREDLSPIFSHTASITGQVERIAPRYSGGQFWCGEVCLGEIESFVDLFFRSNAYFGGQFPGRPGDHLPERVPLRSVSLTNLLYVIVGGHRKAGALPGGALDPHWHWGAAGMAGYPPYKHGYFTNKHNLRTMQELCNGLVSAGQLSHSLLFALVPVAPVFLMPNSAYPGDEAAVAELVKLYLTRTSTVPNDNNLLMKAADQVVADWLSKSGASISEYLRGRFSRRRSVENPGAPDSGKAIVSSEVMDLGMKDACMLVGALMKSLGGLE